MVKNKRLVKYIDLIDRYIRSEITIDIFEEEYLKMVKNEDFIFDKEESKIIETLFSDLDAYCGDSSIANYDSDDPFSDINENELKKRAEDALNQLRQINMII